jgi:hypothetical protein
MAEPSRRTITRRLAAAVVLLAGSSLAALEASPIADLFLRATPTLHGSFSLLAARPLLSVVAHLALVAIGLHRLIASEAVAVATRASARLCYGALAVELLSLAPCAFGGDALCGVFYVLVLPATALAILVGFATYLVAARSRALVVLSSGALLLGAASALAAWWIVTPRSPVDCERIDEPIKRGTCLVNFALRTSAAALCEEVDFDSSRWSCLYELAERAGDPTLCERIVLPCRAHSPGPTCDPDTYRDTCFLVVARKLRDPRLCERLTARDLRTSCLEQVR